MQDKIIKILLFLAIIFIPLGVARAADTKAGESVYISKDEIVSGNLYVAGETITIDGNVSGDLIAAAQTINVNGRIDGDIIAASQNITINGEVGGNIRVAGASITLNGPVARNVNAFGSNIILGSDAVVGWDAFIAGASLEMRGLINGGLSGSVGRALISGKIAKGINLKMSENKISEGLIVSPDAMIDGNLIYTANKSARLSEKATISGKVEQRMPETKEVNSFAVWSSARLFSILCALVVGLLLILLFKKLTPKITTLINKKPKQSLLPGLVIMLILPPAALLLMITIIGIPLALILSALWLAAIYVAKVLAAITVGEIILKTLFKKTDAKLIWSLLLGVIVCWLLFAIPFVGWIICLVAIWLGLGGLWLYASNQYRNL